MAGTVMVAATCMRHTLLAGRVNKDDGDNDEGDLGKIPPCPHQNARNYVTKKRKRSSH